MIRNWVTLLNGGCEIERQIYKNQRGHEYVRVHGKKLFLDRLERDGRIVDRYQCGREDVMPEQENSHGGLIWEIE